jgi:hypothetical protein
MFSDLVYGLLGRIWEFFDGSERRVAAHPKKNPQFILYMMKVSPYSRRVLRALDRAGYGIEIRDVIESEQAFQELMRGGKRDQVPCLRIRAHEKSTEVEDQWMYESKDIITFLLKG